MLGFVNERTFDLIYFHFKQKNVHTKFSKTLKFVSHNIHVSKLRFYNLDAWTTRWVSSSLDGWVQGVIINEPYTSLGAGNEWSTATLSCDLSCLRSFS